MIEIISVAGLATVQDGGRPGHLHEGVPAGGALVPQMLARANIAACNPPREAAIEVLGAIAIVARGAIVVATDDGNARPLRDDETYTIAAGPKTRLRYLAVRGGIDVPVVLGGRGTLLVACLGGHEGRTLRKGDALRVRNASRHNAPLPPAPNNGDAPVRVVLGPDLDRFDSRTIETFLASRFTVDARSDRVGTRLVGPPLVCEQDPAGVSGPMVRGAIQVPPSGELIVLGPDHPTMGGYPVVATVTLEHQGALAARPIGASVHFVSSH